MIRIGKRMTCIGGIHSDVSRLAGLLACRPGTMMMIIIIIKIKIIILVLILIITTTTTTTTMK